MSEACVVVLLRVVGGCGWLLAEWVGGCRLGTTGGGWRASGSCYGTRGSVGIVNCAFSSTVFAGCACAAAAKWAGIWQPSWSAASAPGNPAGEDAPAHLPALPQRCAAPPLPSPGRDLAALYEEEGRRLVSDAACGELLAAAAEGPRASDRFAAVAAAALAGLAASAGSAEIIANFLDRWEGLEAGGRQKGRLCTVQAGSNAVRVCSTGWFTCALTVDRKHTHHHQRPLPAPRHARAQARPATGERAGRGRLPGVPQPGDGCGQPVCLRRAAPRPALLAAQPAQGQVGGRACCWCLCVHVCASACMHVGAYALACVACAACMRACMRGLAANATATWAGSWNLATPGGAQRT